MNNFSQRFPDPRLSRAGLLIPELPTATCQLCEDTFPISREEEARIHGYPPRPYVCPLCRRLMEEAEESICNEILSRMAPDSLQADHCNTNKTEVMKNERYDEKCEPDEASDDEYEALSHELEDDCQGGSAKEGGNDEFQAEAERPLRIHVELVMNLRIAIG